MQKWIKKSKIDIINFSKKTDKINKKTKEKYFESNKLSLQVNELIKIGKSYDFILVSTWNGAEIAFLAKIPYVFYFIGNEIRNPPFLTEKSSIKKKYYKNILKEAKMCISSGSELFNLLKKYRKDSKRIDRVFLDYNRFNKKEKLIKKAKKKFIFFCPQKIGIDKGTNIIWDAIKISKLDFEVHQVNWYSKQNSNKNKSFWKKRKPKQVVLIPKISRKDISDYYRFSDGIIGDMYSGYHNSVEREAVACGKVVIAYHNPKRTTVLDGKRIPYPFLPKKNKPIEISKIIDKVVLSQEFRKQLLKKEKLYVKELCNPKKTNLEWQMIFDEIKNHL